MRCVCGDTEKLHGLDVMRGTRYEGCEYRNGHDAGVSRVVDRTKQMGSNDADSDE